MSQLFDVNFRDEVRNLVRAEVGVCGGNQALLRFVGPFFEIVGTSAVNWLVLLLVGSFYLLMAGYFLWQFFQWACQIHYGAFDPHLELPSAIVAHSMITAGFAALVFVVPLNKRLGWVNVFYPRRNDSIRRFLGRRTAIVVCFSLASSIFFYSAASVNQYSPTLLWPLIFTIVNGLYLWSILAVLIKFGLPGYDFGSMPPVFGFVVSLALFGVADLLVQHECDSVLLILCTPFAWAHATYYFVFVCGAWQGWLFLLPVVFLLRQAYLEYFQLVDLTPQRDVVQHQLDKIEEAERSRNGKSMWWKEREQQTILENLESESDRIEFFVERVAQRIEEFDPTPRDTFQKAAFYLLPRTHFKIWCSGKESNHRHFVFGCTGMSILALAFFFVCKLEPGDNIHSPQQSALIIGFLGSYFLVPILLADTTAFANRLCGQTYPISYFKLSLSVALLVLKNIVFAIPWLACVIVFLIWHREFGTADIDVFVFNILITSVAFAPIVLACLLPPSPSQNLVSSRNVWLIVIAFAITAALVGRFVPMVLDDIFSSVHLRIAGNAMTGFSFFVWFVYGLWYTYSKEI